MSKESTINSKINLKLDFSQLSETKQVKTLIAKYLHSKSACSSSRILNWVPYLLLIEDKARLQMGEEVQKRWVYNLGEHHFFF